MTPPDRPARDFDGKLAAILFSLTNPTRGHRYFLDHEDGRQYCRWGLVEADICAAHAAAVEELQQAHRDDIDWREHGHNVG